MALASLEPVTSRSPVLQSIGTRKISQLLLYNFRCIRFCTQRSLSSHHFRSPWKKIILFWLGVFCRQSQGGGRRVITHHGPGREKTLSARLGGHSPLSHAAWRHFIIPQFLSPSSSSALLELHSRWRVCFFASDRDRGDIVQLLSIVGSDLDA